MSFHTPKICKQLITLFLICLSVFANAQKEALIEKIYAHTDRTFYFPGETIWFKGYITDSEYKISNISEVLHAELISPKGDVVNNRKLKIKNGYAYGDFPIQQNQAGGIYKLKLFTSWMKNYGESALFTKDITVQKVIEPKLLLSLDFKKKAYGPGENVIANFKVENLKNQALADYQISFNVATKGKIILKETITTNKEGKCDITFQLPKNLSSQDVLLNVLIPHKGSQESISRSVPVVLNNIDLQFLPESGNLLENTENTIAFKAVNEFGKPVDVSGIIIDAEGNQITKFSSFHDGMGSFNLIPKSNKKYQAFITKPFNSKKPIPIVKAITKGTILKLIEHKEESLLLKIVSNSEKEIKLIASSIGKTTYEKTHSLKLSKTSGFYEKNISLDTEDFPIGITSFIVFDLNDNPLAERLLFLNKDKELNIEIELNKKLYNIREHVSVKVKTTDKNNKPVPANLSISVADNSLITLADDKQDHILSSLLVSSELKGKIHEPVFYFDKTKEKSSAALDYIMLTNGWRTWIKKPLFSEEKTKYPAERSGIIRGTVTDTTDTPITAQLILFDNQSQNAVVFKTDQNGNFEFKSGESKYEYYTLLAYRNDNKIVKIADNFIRKTDKNGLTTITIDGKEAINQASKIVYEKSIIQKQKAAIKQPEEEVTNQSTKPPNDTGISAFSLEEDSSKLDEIVVVGYGTQKKRSLTGSVTKIYANEISNPSTNIEQALQGKVAGVTVNSVEAGANTQIKIRGAGSISSTSAPLIVVDGYPIGTSAGILSSIDTSNISSLNVLKDAASTAIYGSRGANGVIIINTKNYYNRASNLLYRRKQKYNYATRTYSGSQKYYYNYGRSFYKPIYDNDKIAKERTDFRKTIYWNPVVQTNEKGEASFDFYNSDAITSFKIITEGIGANATIGRDETVYSAKKILDVDFKIPNYSSVNDQIIIPITITNESNKDIGGSLSLKLPYGFKTTDIIQEFITVPANNFIHKNITVTPTKRIYSSNVTVAFNSSEYSDVNRKKIKVLETLFPIYSSISDSKNKTFTYNLENAVPSSITSDFITHINVLSDVTEGVAAMVRKPSGCFEQFSSKTHPNILALKYLKDTNKKDPKTKRKALRYIKEGYNKLAGYQVKSGGFEWFGSGLGNEGLTAYGLMLFHDMKDTYDGVDEFMLKKAKNWLLSRRDSIGGFNQNNGKYGYACAPEKITNAYIVYALSEIDPEISITSQYKKAFNEALISKDNYRMALMGLASSNYGLKENKETLTNEILRNINKHGLESLSIEGTITRSYDNSQNIETNALIFSLLLKSKEKHSTQIKLIKEHILRKRRYGSFGNTQATSTALKALLQYAKTISNPKKIDPELDKLRLIVNNDTITKKLSEREYNRIIIDSLEKHLTTGKQKFSVHFSDSEKSFPYTINSRWFSTIPDSAPDCLVNIETLIDNSKSYKVGDNIRMQININNNSEKGLPMTTAVIGIPSGLSTQPWQLKEIIETNKADYYEIFENYLVFYWVEMGPREQKIINLDLKAEIAGSYTAPPSSVYLYYTDDKKHWVKGNFVKVTP